MWPLNWNVEKWCHIPCNLILFSLKRDVFSIGDMCLPKGLLLEVQQKLNLSTYPKFSWEVLATRVEFQVLVYFADMIRVFSK